MKGGASHSTRTPEDSCAHMGVPLDATTWASTWEMMNRTLKIRRTQTQVTEEVANPEKPSRNLKNLKTIQMVALTHGLK